jgi:predicted  nucleic acid-binding Zn-ribbon protein
VEESDTESPLQLLVWVQERDIELDQIAYKRRELPERKRLAALEADRARLSSELSRIDADRVVLAKRQAEIDAHVQAFASRIKQIDERLASSAAGSFRDQQAMGAERDSLALQQKSTEDHELEVMEQLEPMEADMSRLTAELDRISAARAIAADELGAADGELAAAAASVAAKRSELAARLPADLAATYERLRNKLGGIGAAKLVGGACGGCHLVLPSRERDQLLHAPAGTVVYCEQCGRILVP